TSDRFDRLSRTAARVPPPRGARAVFVPSERQLGGEPGGHDQTADRRPAEPQRGRGRGARRLADAPAADRALAVRARSRALQDAPPVGGQVQKTFSVEVIVDRVVDDLADLRVDLRVGDEAEGGVAELSGRRAGAL